MNGQKIVMLLATIFMAILLSLSFALAEDNTLTVSTYEELVTAVATINSDPTTEYRVEITADFALMDHIEIYGKATIVASGGDYTLTVGTGTAATTNTKRFKLMNSAVVSFGEADATNTLTLGNGGSQYAIVAGFSGSVTSSTTASTLNLYDGVLITGHSGIGIVGESKAYYMYGGAITNNTVSQSGSGVYMSDTAVFNMYGGEISGNHATGSGGGFYLKSSGNVVNISGGTISSNTAKSSGGNIYVGDSSAKVNISGDANILAASADADHTKSIAYTSVDSMTYSDLTSNANIDVPSSFTLSVTEGQYETYKDSFNPPDGYYAVYEDGALQFTNIYYYTLAYDSNRGSGTIEDVTYEKGTTVIVATNTFSPPVEKEFNHWNTSADATGTSYSEGSTVVMTDDVELLTKCYFVNLHTLYSVHLSVKPPHIVASNRKLEFVNSSDVTLYAIWSDPTYTVNFVIDGTTYPVKGEQNTTILSNLIPSSNKAGYEVDAWYTDENYTKADDLTQPFTADTILYAKLAPITYQLTFDESGDMISVTYDTPIGASLPIPTKENYYFSHWVIDDDRIDEDTVWNYTTGKTANAVWDLSNVQIVYTEGEFRDALDESEDTDIVVGADITITSDVTFTRPVTVQSNGDYVIDNGTNSAHRFFIQDVVNFGDPSNTQTQHTLTLCLGRDKVGVALSNANAKLNMYEGICMSGSNPLDVTDSAHGVALTSSGAEFHMYGGTICDVTTSNLGAGVYLYASSTSFYMHGGVIQNNIATGKDGGGVYIETGSQLNLYGATITNNSANNGGGVYGDSNTNINMDGATITDNKATSGSGGGIYANAGGTFSLTDSTITGNTSTNTGGGSYINNTTANETAVISGNTITGNSSSGNNGGGIYFTGTTTMEMSDNTITDNEANNGGGVYINSASTVTMDDSTVDLNTARNGSGGGLYIQNATVTITDTSVDYNSATSNGGGIYITGATANVTVTSRSSMVRTVTTTGSTIDNNSATKDGNCQGVK